MECRKKPPSHSCRRNSSDMEYIVALAGRRLEHRRRQLVASFFQRRSAFASHCCDLHTWHLGANALANETSVEYEEKLTTSR
jgi:hypothetical protein